MIFRTIIFINNVRVLQKFLKICRRVIFHKAHINNYVLVMLTEKVEGYKKKNSKT